IYSSYNVTGAWNSPSVSYKAANLDTNADLSALTCDLGAVSPIFKANVTSYTGPNYPYYKNKAGITATVAETGASLKINGEAATSGVLKYVPIAVGANDIPVVVTSKDSSTTKTYTLTITRESGGSYNLTVVNGSKDPDTDTVEAGDTVTITANTPAAGKVFDKWTSEDGVTFANASSSTTTFTMPAKEVTVTATYKDDPDMDTELRNIEVNITTPSTSWEYPALTPVYDKATRTYTLNVSTEYNTIYFYLQEMLSGQSVSATVDGAPLTVNTALNGFQTVQHTLTKAKTVFVFTVTAKDGITTGTYTVTVNRGSGTTYALTVINGTTTTPTPAEGDTVTITANPPATGKVFDKWTTSDGVEFANANSATTTFVMPAKAVAVTATYKDISSETPDYKIIDGENGIWKKGNTKGIVIISNGDYGDFTGVNVDGIFIDSSNYTSAAGSTVVTLKPAYLETLAVGTHIVTLQFGNYSVQTNLTILAADERPDESKPDESKPDESKPNEEIPKTGDSNHTLPLIGLLLLSGSALIGVTRNKKKKKSYNK
ncbi:MAG TPA: LPXTG cell wall anchor domain-containing protein, partial [Bacteroidales bacterium]|nr:LPXTG cell wall anchor domain-containing protein [Bacteroidales bacterium]